MYFSLNKKIFYTILTLFTFIGILFLTMFTVIYTPKYSADYTSTLQRSQYVSNLLYENITLQREISKLKGYDISEESSGGRILYTQEELDKERKINDAFLRNYNEQSQAFIDGMKIIGISSLLSLCSIFVLGVLLQKWVVSPIKKLTKAAEIIAQGDLSYQIPIGKRQVFFDEFDTLATTFNAMIQNLKTNIAKIKNSEMFLQSLIDAIPDGIRVIDKNHNVVMANTAYYKQIKVLENTSYTGKCFEAYNYTSPCPEGTYHCPMKDIISRKSKPVTIIQNAVGKPLAVNAAPLCLQNNDNQEDMLIIESIRDLSDDVRFSHQQKISSLGFLATSVAHEMKNNLGAIRMVMEALKETSYKKFPKDSTEVKYLDMVTNQIIESVKIPERLLKLAQNNTDEQKVFDIRIGIEEVISLLDYEAKRNGVEIKTKLPNTATEMLGNETDFKMILLNLTQNALKAMPSGGLLEIKSTKDKNNINITVRDTGVGIEEKNLVRIFEPFYSGQEHQKGQGTGLGLAIVKSLVDKYNGNITVSSIIGQGTVFEIKFPKLKK